MVEATCPKQKNSYDCGVFVMHFMESVLEKIDKGEDLETIEEEPKGMRA